MSYTTVKMQLSKVQQSKLKKAKESSTSVTLLLSKSNIDKKPSYQLRKLEKHGSGHITFSKTQLKSQGAGLWDALMKAGRWLGRGG